jgi:D-3-phosphoglycerate dehydrogenase / 2-oxoglutarate reductase
MALRAPARGSPGGVDERPVSAVRILHLEPECYPEDVLERLRAAGSLDVLAGGDRETLLRRLEQTPYDALFVRLGCSVDRAVFERQPSLRFVVTPTTGLDHIDLVEADRRGVRVISLAGETEFLRTIRSTAEHTWALLLALVRRLPTLAERGRAGIWARSDGVAAELNGRTLGIVGLGRLGTMVAGYGIAFEMRVVAFDRDPAAFDGAPGAEPLPLDELLAAADVVSLHLPGSAENAGFLDAGRIARMRPGAVLVNTARGEIVDETALLAALESGRLAGAALDVLAGDSSWDGAAPPDHPLLALARRSDRLLVTPHVGGHGDRSVAGTRAFVTERFLAEAGA